jgi:hypothetical protein
MRAKKYSAEIELENRLTPPSWQPPIAERVFFYRPDRKTSGIKWFVHFCACLSFREKGRETERKRQAKRWERIWAELVNEKKGSTITGDSKRKEAP